MCSALADRMQQDAGKVADMRARSRQELARRELARRRFRHFPGYVDPEQAENYGADHLQLIAEYLEKAESGELWEGMAGSGKKILLIEAPPRHWKTSTLNKFAAWFVGKRKREGRPHQVMMISYGATLAETNSRGVLELVQEPRYQNLFPEVELNRNMQSASLWGLAGETQPTTVAGGVGGPLTGQGADCMIIDDPVKGPEDAYSEASRESKWLWMTTVAFTRINPGGFMVLTLTRWHDEDVAGKLLKQVKEGKGGHRVVVLRLPALAETQEERESAGELGLPVDEEDPLGREPGEALWPEQYSAEELEAVRDTDEVGFEALFQGRPGKEGGYLLGRHQLKLLEVPPEEGTITWCIPTDWAMTEKEQTPRQGTEPDWTVAGLVGLWLPEEAGPENARIVIAAVERVQARIPEARKMVKRFARQVEERLGERPTIVAAQDNIDTVALDDLRGDTELLSWPILNIARKMMKGDKVVKSEPWRSRAVNGRVYVVSDSWWGKPWNSTFFVEVEAFPRGAKDDQVDMVSAGYHFLARNKDGVDRLPNIWDLDQHEWQRFQKQKGVVA